MTLPDFTTPEAVANHLGLPVRKVRALARGIGAARIVGRDMIFLQEDVDEIARHLAVPPDKLPIPMIDDRTYRSSVYFIRVGDKIKIGVTTSDARARLKALSTAHWEDLEILAIIQVAGLELERKLHKQFAHLRIRPDREWFRAGDDLLEYINGLK